MSLSAGLLKHASDLLLPAFNEGGYPSEVNLRRSISAAYYALFHKINEDAAGLIAPNVSPAINHRIQRWFDHVEMKKICGRFTQAELDQPLRGLIGISASDDLQMVASSFVELQNERHSADYDLSFHPATYEVYQLLSRTVIALQAWDRLRGSAEANIFILSLLLWKNWERER